MITKIIFGMIALVVITLMTLVVMQIIRDKQISGIWRSLATTPTTEYFTPDLVAALPDVAKRYFLHAIQPGTPLASCVKLKMHGSFKLGENGTWMTMQAEEMLSPPTGFVWKSAIAQGFFQMVGADYYVNRSGRMQFALWGIIPLVNAHNPDINRSSIGRLAGESFWLPAALLPQRGVFWEAIDEKSVKASLKIDDEPVTLTLVVNSDGKLLHISFLRWGNQTKTGEFNYIPFGADFGEERTFGGYTIPSQVNAGWWFGTERYAEFFRVAIAQAEFC